MITLKSADEIKKIREGGRKLAEVVFAVMRQARPGVSTIELDRLAEELIRKVGGRPSFKNFNGYSNATCISVNHEVVHAIPRPDKVLKAGDVVGIDIGLEYQGLFTDMTRTVLISQATPEARKLVQAAKEALRRGIREIRPGRTTGDFGATVQEFVERRGFSVVRSLVGHGVGHQVHEAPRLPNFGQRGEGEVLKEGMVLALEPMVNAGGHEVITAEDGWTVVTADGSLSAHFEDTVVVTKHGPEVVTK